MKCPNCGYFNLPGAEQCGSCRRAFSAAPASSGAVPIAEIYPPRAKARGVGAQVKAHSPTTRQGIRWLEEWRRRRQSQRAGVNEKWTWADVMWWWLSPLLSIVPGLGHIVQKRFISGACFIAGIVLAVLVGIYTIRTPYAEWCFYCVPILMCWAIRDCAQQSFPPGAPEAAFFRSVRLWLMTVVMVGLLFYGAMNALNARYALVYIAMPVAQDTNFGQGPDIKVGDTMILQRANPENQLFDLHHGDVVVSGGEEMTGLPIMERITGLPRDRVVYDGTILSVNGKQITGEKLPLNFRTGAIPFDVTVAKDKILLWVFAPANEGGLMPYITVDKASILGRFVGCYNPPPRRRWFRERNS